MHLGQVAAGDVAVGLERGQTRGLTYFESAFELYLTDLQYLVKVSLVKIGKNLYNSVLAQYSFSVKSLLINIIKLFKLSRIYKITQFLYSNFTFFEFHTQITESF